MRARATRGVGERISRKGHVASSGGSSRRSKSSLRYIGEFRGDIGEI